jgi:hypothetical protein
MLSLKLIAVITLATFVSNGGAASACRSLNYSAQIDNAVTRLNQNDTQTGALKIVAEDFHSPITQPFVAVVRDTDTYAALIKLDRNLPKLDAEFFQTNFVVAAFLGERNTGGYSVDINRDDSGAIRIEEKKPGKDMMVTQVITSPFKLVSGQGNPTIGVSLILGEVWSTAASHYRITNSQFTMSGGIAGVREQFELEGEMGMLRSSNLATFAIVVKGSGAASNHVLTDTTTAIVDRKGQILIKKMSAGTLVYPPIMVSQPLGQFPRATRSCR